ncbi:MAG: hemolysin family protein [Bacteroidales bacterium]
MNSITGILISIALSAFFSGMEIAFVSSNKLRFELDKKQKSLSASILSLFYDNSENFISTLLVGNNIALVVYGMIMASMLEPFIAQFIPNDAVVVIIQTIVSTLIILLTAEFLPKTIFRINPNFSLKLFAMPLLLIYIVLYPISKFASLVSKLSLKLLGIKVHPRSDKKVFGKIDLNYFIKESIDDALNNSEMDTEVKIFQKALDFSNVRIRDCMIPRTDLVAVEWNSEIPKLISTFTESGYSKLPIYRESIDNIIGYIHSSEMFNSPEDWHKRINKMPFVPETMAAHKLMKLLMQQKKSIAVVVDEHGGTAGIVTLEDLLEEIIGDIQDEHDTNSLVAKQLNADEYIVSGRYEIDKLNELFSINLPESEEYSTVAGYILHHSQRFPSANEVVEIPPYQFKVIKASDTRIDLIKFKAIED